jgi:hypothetical protein
LALDNLGLEDASFTPLEDEMGHSSYTTSKCLSGLSIKDIQKVTKPLDLKELHILCKSKIRSLKVDESIVSNKLLGIKYNFQDRKIVVEKTQAELRRLIGLI